MKKNKIGTLNDTTMNTATKDTSAAQPAAQKATPTVLSIVHMGYSIHGETELYKEGDTQYETALLPVYYSSNKDIWTKTQSTGVDLSLVRNRGMIVVNEKRLQGIHIGDLFLTLDGVQK